LRDALVGEEDVDVRVELERSLEDLESGKS
jgi:hypothetical protein